MTSTNASITTGLPANAGPLVDIKTGQITQPWYLFLQAIWKRLGTINGVPNGVTWTSGNGAPTSLQPTGSLYSRLDGMASGEVLYVSHGDDGSGGGTWTGVAA